MQSRQHRKDRQFTKGVLVFGGTLAGFLAVGIFLSGVLGGNDSSSPRNMLASGEPAMPAVQEDGIPASPETGVAVEKDTLPPVPPVLREVTYAEAEQAFSERRYAEALDLFTVYTDRHPGNVWGHYMYGLSAWKAGEPEAAISGFESAIELDPRHLKSRTNLVRVLLDECRPGEALPHARQAVELDPECGESHRILARVHHNLGDVEPAVESYRKAIELNGKDVWAMNNLGLLLIERERFEEAVAPLALATRLDRSEVVFQNNLGIALERTGRYSSAADAFRAALAVDDTNRKVLANLERVDGRTDEGPSLDLDSLAVRYAERMSGTDTSPTANAPSTGTEKDEDLRAGEASPPADGSPSEEQQDLTGVADPDSRP